MPLESSFLTRSARALRQALPWALTLAVATCTNDRTGPSDGGTGFFTFRPVYQGVTGSLSRFGIVADSVHIRLTRPIDELVLDTTVFFHPDSNSLNLALPIDLESSPESLSAVIEIKAGSTLLFVDSLDVQVFDGPPSATEIPTVLLDYVGPGNSMAVLTLIPDDTTIAFGDTLFFDATAEDSSAQSIPDFYVAWSTSNPAIATINGEGRLIAPNTRTTLQIIGETPTGIADTTLVTFAPIPNAILADSGNTQSGVAGDSLGVLFVARVMAGDALGVAGIPVRFQVVTGGGAIRDTVLVTDANGRVRTRGVLSTTAGAHSWSATVIGTAITTTFTATANAGLPSGISILGGNLQSDSAGRLLPNPFAVHVTDAFTNPVPGVKIYWTRILGTGALTADSTFTDAGGNATVTYTLGAVGVDSVTATIAGTGASVGFQATAINGAPALVNKVLGDAQSDTVGNLLADSFAVTVRSATNQPVVGSPVAWTVLRGGSVSLDTVLTDVNGRAAVAYTLGGAPGVDSVRAQAGGASAIFTADALTGAASVIGIVSGNNQTDTLLRAISLPFRVGVTDALGNPVAGVEVAFSLIAGSGTLFGDTIQTDLAGEAAMGYLLGAAVGVDSIRVDLVGTGAFVTFALNVIAGTPTDISVVGGGSQTDTVRATLATPLSLSVVDNQSHQVPGAIVTFTGTGGATFSQSVDTADAAGLVSTVITFGDTATLVAIVAQVQGFPALADTSFYIANPGLPASLAMVSGDGQTDSTGNTLPLPLVVRMTDAAGNVFAGAEVVWTVVSGTGALSDDTTLTSGLGETFVFYQLGPTQGTDTLRATLVASGATVDFTTNALSGAPSFFALISGNNQVDTVLSTLADSLVVELRDLGNNPVAGEWIYWTTAGMFTSADSTLTGLDGRAAVQVTFDSIAFQGVVLAHTADTLIGMPFIVTATAGLPQQMQEISGNGQTAEILTALPDSFMVFVQDAYGNPAGGAAVTFDVAAGSGSVVPDTAIADSIGLAVAHYTLGSVVGTDTILALLVAQPASVEFTATGTSGAATSLVYMAGTGQSDTVGQELPFGFVVQARDASSNPVQGVYVQWEIISGGGVLFTDSTLTDAGGAGNNSLTLGTTVGVDSVRAFIPGVADTIVFYAASVADAPAELFGTSGSGQSGQVNSVISPLGAAVTDQYGNPISGFTVDFAQPVGGSDWVFGVQSPVTDGNGFASTVDVTIGDTAGVFTVIATSALIPTDTAFYTVTVLPLGASKSWNGLLSIDFGDPDNWSPVGVPTGADNVYIPFGTPNSAHLDVSRTIGGLEIATGADLNVQGNVLTLNGDLTVDGTLSRSSGHTVLGGSGMTARGNIGAIENTGSYTLAGATTVESNLQVTSGSFGVGGQTLTINGDLDISGGGAFVMTSAADSVQLNGSTTFNGSTGVGLLSAGTLVITGDFTETSGSATFRASGTHRTIFAGASTQIVQFTSPGLGLDQFQEVTFANAAGVVLNSGFAVAGIADITTPVSGPGMVINVGGGIADEGSPDLTVGFLVLEGSPTVLPDTVAGWVEVMGTVTLADDIAVLGNVDITSGSLQVNGNTLTIGGDLTTGGGGAFIMQSAVDTVDVSGMLSFNGSTATGHLTDGVLILRGAFLEVSGSATFRASGNHTTIFAGTSVQTIQMVGAALGLDQFQHLRIENPSGVSLNSDIAAGGDATVDAGVLTSGGGTATVAGNIFDNVGSAWAPELTVLTGNPTTLPLIFLGSLETQGTVTLAAGTTVSGNFSVTGGAFSPGGNPLTIGGDLAVSGGAQFLMQDPSDIVDVAGNTTWNGSTATGLLTAGTLNLQGHFNETSGSSTFRASGAHLTRFAGTTAQNVVFNAPSLGGDQFEVVEFANAAGVTLLSDIAVGDIAAVSTGFVNGAAVTATLTNGLSDGVGNAWLTDNTILAGTVTNLPSSFARNVQLTGTATLAAPLSIGANLVVEGTITLNGFALDVDSALMVSGGGQVAMNSATDSLDVGGPAVWDGSPLPGLLTQGVAVYRGDFTVPGPSSVYQSSGTHRSVFAGSAAQSVTFAVPSMVGNRFSFLELRNPTTVTFNGDIPVLNSVSALDGVVNSAGGTVTISDQLSVAADSIWQPLTTAFATTPTTLPDTLFTSVQIQGSWALAQPTWINGALSVTGTGDLLVNGQALTVSGALTIANNAQFRMQDPSDSVTVAGNVSWNGSTSAGLLTDGELVLYGSFIQPSLSAKFQASGNHRTVLVSDFSPTITFFTPDYSTNRFNRLELQGTGTITLGSTINVADSLIKAPAGGVTVAGSNLFQLQTREMAVDGVTFDSVQVVARGTGMPSLDNVTFIRQDPTGVAMELVSGGDTIPKEWTNVQFFGTWTTGQMITAIDSAENSESVDIRMMNSFPLDGSTFAAVGGSNSPIIRWTTLVFADPPLDIAALATLAPVRVAVLDPNGDTLTSYANQVGLAIGTNPGGSTLGGTTVQFASGGIATFNDLTLDAPGFGYTLTAGSTTLNLITSATFNITALMPAGFDLQWTGVASSDWFDPANWSTGVVPDSTLNVYVSAFSPNQIFLDGDTGYVKRFLVASGATVGINNPIVLVADSSVEVLGVLNNAGTVVLRGTGDVSGSIFPSIVEVHGTYAVAGTANWGFGNTILGDLTIGNDTLSIPGGLFVGGSGRLIMSSADALVDVGGNAQFFGGSTTGALTLGTLRIAGGLATGGSNPDAFSPDAGHLTILNGSSPQSVNFASPDSVSGSHFGRLQVSTAGAATMMGRYDALGDLLITSGATLTDNGDDGFEAHGFTGIDAGGALDVNSFRTRGGLGVAVGASYSVATTTYYGGGPFPINPAPYDTLVLQLHGEASGDLVVTGDLRIDGGTAPARFDPNGFNVNVAGSMNIVGNGALIMQDAADTLFVTGSFSTNGASTDGLLTAGWLRIGGSFDQAADGSGEAFRAGPNHVTEFFFGGPTGRHLEFDSPSGSPTDPTGSHFGQLLLPIGFDTIIGRVPAAGQMFIAAATVQDTTFPSNMLVGYDSVVVSSASPSLQLRTLEVWGGLEVQGAVPYDVVNTRIMGGPNGTLAPLAYQSLLIANTSQTLGANLTLPGDLDLGFYCGEGGECSAPGDLTVNGFDLIIGGRLSVAGHGQLHMATGDSVDVTGDLTYRTDPSAGNLTGGTLVARAMFNTVGANAYQPDAAHQTVFAAPGNADLYPTTGSRFGKLLILDNGLRRIRSSQAVVVLDTLMIGNAASIFADTAFTINGAIVAQGPVITVAGSSLQMEGSVRFEHNSILIGGSYASFTTYFAGTGQTIPTLPLQHIGIEGTVQLAAPLDIGGNNFIINGNSGPADFDLNGFSLAVGYFGVSGQGTLTSTDVGSSLLVRSDAVFNGGDHTGKLTEGTITVRGDFTQDTTFSLSSYVSGSNHTTVFADSSPGGSAVILNSMFTGNSRFNDVAVHGRGVQFYGAAWIDGDVDILAALVDSVDGQAARLGGSLNATGNRWKVDTTTIAAVDPLLPDSIDGNVLFLLPDSLEQGLRVAGHLTIFDTLIPHPGGTLEVDSLFAATGAGLLVMTHPAQRVEIEGNAFFDGATSTGWLTAGVLKVNGGLFRGPTNTLAFDATGNHTVYIDSMSDGSVISFQGATGGGLQNLRIGSVGLTLTSDLLVRGDLYHDGESPDPIFGGNNLLTVHGLVEQQTIFENLRVAIPEQNTLFDVFFQNMDPTVDQLTVFGNGSPEPLQLGTIRFLTTPTTGNLLHLVDTLADGDSLLVEMMSSTPAQGDDYTAITGDARAAWPKLVLNAFPVTVDSAISFTITVGIMNPDSSPGNTSAGNATIALEANPLGNTLGGTLNIPFGGVSASFTDLSLLLPGIGTSFRVSIDGRPTDTLVTPTLSILNPAPGLAIIFDNEGGDNLWSNPINWVGDAIPLATDSVFIPGTQFVQFDLSNDTVGTLVLGIGAQLDLAPSTNLTLTGRLTAGNTVTGSGTLYLDGAVTEVTGTIFPETYVTGQINALGTVNFNNGLTVDGAGADFNVAGATVTVNGIFGTSNGGVLTMDGPTDSLIVNEAFFNGGSTLGSLTAGTLVIAGADFSAAGPSPSSFAATGTHTVVFEDAGDNSNISLSDADSSYFQNLLIKTPNSVLVSTPTARLTVWGNLDLDDDGALTGDTIGVAGRVTMGGASANLTLGLLTIGGNGNLIQGNYNVPWTQYVGTAQDIAGATYENLDLNGSIQSLTGNVVANQVTASNGPVDLNGFNITTDTLRSVGTGAWMMNDAADTIVVNLFAQFSGGAFPMSAGYLEVRGDFDVGSNANMFDATAGHTTRFVGAANHLVDFPGEGQFTRFGTLVIDTGTVVLEDDVQITGDLILRDGSLADSSGIREVRVNGGINADNGLGTHLMVGELTLTGGFTFAADSSRYDVNELRLVGTGQTLPGMLHYRTIRVRGTAALSAHIWTDNLRVDSTGVLDLNGFALQVDTVLNVTENGHLLMQDPADFLSVGETAFFQGANSTGDYTDGIIRARHFVSQMGPSGDLRSFVQLGSNRIVPQAGDTISMWNGGPIGSMLKTLVLEGQGGPVHVGGPALWIADSLVIVQTADSLVGMSGTELIVGFASGVVGTVHVDLGTLAVEALGVGGPLSRNAGTYDVQLTKFIGSSQPIPGNLPFRDVEVQYSAFLTGDLTLTGAGQRFQVNNSGDFDLGGHRLAVDTFSTSGFGILRMDADADTLRADAAIFAGGSTVGTLTAGELEVGVLRQFYNADSTSFAASGTHQTTFLDIGGFTESGREVLFQTPHDTLSHFNRVRFLGNTGNRFLTNVYALDTVVINNSINQFSGVSLVSAGPVFIGNAADIDIDTLRMGDTLVIDPSATTFLDNWVFGPTAKTPPEWGNYSNVFLENSLTLQDSLHFQGEVVVRQGAVLTLNGNNFTTESGFTLLDSARLVMATNDTLFTGSANWGAGPTGTDLAGGLIRMSGQFWQMPTGDPASFSPTGTVVEFAGGSPQSVQFTNPGSSYFRDWRIIGKQMYMNTFVHTAGDLFIDSMSAIVDWSIGGMEFMGKVTVDSGGAISDADALTNLTFNDSLLVHPAATYNVFNSAFRTNFVPNLPYQWLILQEGTHDTLTTDISASNGLILHAATPGGMDLVLNGNSMNVGSLSVQGFGRFTMDNPLDSMVIASDAYFDGDDLTGRLTDGFLRLGANVIQTVGFSGSNRSLRTDGVRVEFYGPTSHLLTYATPDTGASYIGNVAIQGGGTLLLGSGSAFTGRVDVGTSSTLFLSLTPANHDFFGVVNVGASASLQNTNSGLNHFHDTVFVAAGATYNVAETQFSNVDTLPSVTFTNLYLGNGTDIVLVDTLLVTGQLTLTANAAGNQSLTLNGRKVSAGTFSVATNGRLIMQNPLDSLISNGDVFFDGADETGFLTAGTIYINNHFTQRATTSTSSGRIDGTKLLFNALTPVHIVDLISPLQSPVAEIGAINGSSLSLFLSNSLRSTGDVAHGNLQVMGVPTSELTADSIRATAGVLSITLPKVTAGYIGTSGPVSYTVATTDFTGSSQVPNLTYDTLIVSGNTSLPATTINANWVKVFGDLNVGLSSALHATKTVTVAGTGAQLWVSGGSVLADSVLSTVSDGTLRVTSGSVSTRDASFGGGATTGLLTGGAMNVTGNFEQLGGGNFSFDADSTFTVAINGGGQHTISFADPGTSKFGTLLLEGSGFQTDTTTFPVGTITAYRLSTNNTPVIIKSAGGSQIDVATLGVNGLADSGVRINQFTTDQQPLTFDQVTFRGFTSTDVQLSIHHPGDGILNPTQFFDIDFDNAASPNGTTGFFVRVTDADAITTFLSLQIYGPDSGIGPTLQSLLSGALLAWFPPS